MLAAGAQQQEQQEPSPAVSCTDVRADHNQAATGPRPPGCMLRGDICRNTEPEHFTMMWRSNILLCFLILPSTPSVDMQSLGPPLNFLSVIESIKHICSPRVPF